MDDRARELLHDPGGTVYGLRLDDLLQRADVVSPGVTILQFGSRSGAKDPYGGIGIVVRRNAFSQNVLHQSELTNGDVRAAAGMVARMAHEVRNPLAAICGSAQILERFEVLGQGAEDGQRLELLRCIVSESERLDEVLRRFLQIEDFADEQLREIAHFADSPMSYCPTVLADLAVDQHEPVARA